MLPRFAWDFKSLENIKEDNVAFHLKPSKLFAAFKYCEWPIPTQIDAINIAIESNINLFGSFSSPLLISNKMKSKKDLTSSETSETSKTELEKPKVELPPVLPAEVNPPKKDESDFQTSSSSNVTMDIRTTPEPTVQEKVGPIDTTNLINASGNLSPPLPPTRASTDAPKSVLDNANVSFDLNKNTVTNIERTNSSGFTNYDDDDEVVKITGDDVDIMDDVEELDF